jgi:hypothetical protein
MEQIYLYLKDKIKCKYIVKDILYEVDKMNDILVNKHVKELFILYEVYDRGYEDVIGIYNRFNDVKNAYNEVKDKKYPECKYHVCIAPFNTPFNPDDMDVIDPDDYD